jgi:beta-phosphoglucomutase
MTSTRLRTVIFDFNGVIADDETTHFLAFQQALAEDGLTLTKEEYYGTYLGMDERSCADALLKSVTGKGDTERMQRIILRKAALFRDLTATRKPPLFPGVVAFVKRAAPRYRLAIASGGRREQIEFALQDTPIAEDFAVLVSAEDAAVGKPDPAIYRLTLERINAIEPRPRPLILPEECAVIEDSLAGIQAGLLTGMKVVAVATTYPAHALTAAHLVLPRLEGAALERLEAIFGGTLTTSPTPLD